MLYEVITRNQYKHLYGSGKTALGQVVTFLELLDTSGSVDDFLGAGVEGVALVTDVDTQLFFGAFCCEGVATRTCDSTRYRCRMDLFFHGGYLGDTRLSRALYVYLYIFLPV